MTSEIGIITERALPRIARRGAALAAFTASLGWLSLATEAHRSVTQSLTHGHGLAEALFLFFRFFTIITNIGIAVLMSVTAVRLLTRRALPPARIFNAGMIYILVTCVTYEMILRTHWGPQDMQFFTDFSIHDVIPALTLAFWIGFAPRDGACWRDAWWFLVYPIAYFAMTLMAGAIGEGYPYGFFDVDRLGFLNVLVNALLFLAVFFILGLATTGLSMRWNRRVERGRVSVIRTEEA